VDGVTRMKAAYITRTGPPEVITYGDLPPPVPREGQYLVRVTTVDVNPIDVYWRAGMVPAKMSFPFILGRDLAGVVLEAGSGASRFRPGDRVWATNLGCADRSGTFAEQVAVNEEWLYPIPEHVSDETVVAVSLVGVTAYLGLTQHARLRPGEVLFVNGGSGGVGSCVIQMAKRCGATVITTAGSEAKVERCRQLGADHVVHYKAEVVSDRIRELAPDGVNVWWETVREPDFESAVSQLAVRGRLIVMAGRDARPAFPIGPFYVKDCALHGFAMFNASPEEMRTAAESINAWLSDRSLTAQIDRVLPLSEAAEAHRLQENSTVRLSGELAGKIVLRVSGENSRK
jgi:NADPH2:quinone reductase